MEIKAKKEGRLADADGMGQIMWVQHALQDGPRARQADLPERGAQELDGAAVERVERVSARDSALSHKRFLSREQGRVQFALRRGKRAVYRERPCCVWRKNQ
jgi:hypothetical protein